MELSPSTKSNRHSVRKFMPCAYPEPVYSGPHPSTLIIKIHLLLLSSLNLVFHEATLTNIFVRRSELCLECYMHCPSHFPWFHHANIWRGVQIMKHLITYFSWASCYFLRLGPIIVHGYLLFAYVKETMFYNYRLEVSDNIQNHSSSCESLTLYRQIVPLVREGAPYKNTATIWQ
jgi:hypothetical protein